jgi:hypothetical protein
MVSRTAVAIACVRDGRLAIETTWAKWCVPTFDKAAPATVTKLEIRYPYLEEFTDPLTRRPSVRALLYRRVIDSTSDTTFQPAKASAGGAEPDAWVPDPLKTYEHGLGFCPVVWYPFLKQEGSVAEIDGQAIHQNHLPEIVGLDFALSQRHRATLMTTDPLEFVEVLNVPGLTLRISLDGDKWKLTGELKLPATRAGQYPEPALTLTEIWSIGARDRFVHYVVTATTDVIELLRLEAGDRWPERAEAVS